METGENGLLQIVGRAVLSWLPGSTVDAASKRMSRDFWMPDNSSRYCYECDSQFTIFNRRHHCRICGRVFCGKCTLNTIPLEERVNEDGEKVRVCNFCFKGRQQDNPNFSSVSPSLTPTSSSKSSVFSSSSGGMASPSAASRTSVSNQSQPVSSDTIDYYQSNRLRVRTTRDTSPSPVSPVPSYGDGSYSFRGRSDDEENEQKDQHGCNRDLPCHGPEYYEDDSGTETDIADSMPKHRCNSRNSMNANEDDNAGDLMDSRNIYGGGMTDPLLSRSSRSSEDNNLDDGADEGNLDPVYQAALKEAEQPVDYENNHLIWIPPAPDVEDENAGIEDDEDDEDDVPWALPRSSGSMSSSDHKNRERAASEEHRRAMRAVVDGHFRALVAQLLKSEDVQVGDEDDKESWLEIVTSLALEVAGIVKPDQTGKGGGMDPGGYVKVKCIATGHPIDSMVVKGVVCRKNVAHRRMITRFKNPRLLLLGGSLEYQRVSNQLSSLETLLQQELDHLNMAVARIEAHHPNVLLVEKAVAGHAQTKLLSKEISLVLNVKKPLMDRIARCTGAQIVPSSDNLMNPPKTGHCELFHVETFVEEHGSAGQGGKQLKKTLMFFEGCPKPFGCTILLKGASGDELKKVKRAMQYAVFAAYHLALETSFLADEGASLPDLQSPIVVTLPSKQLASERSITSIPGFTFSSHSMNKIESKPASIDTVSDEVLPGLSTSGGSKISNSQGNILLARENIVQSSAPNENVLTRSVSLKNGSLAAETKQVNQSSQYGPASPHTTDEASFLKSEGTDDLSYSLDADQASQASESKTSVPEAEREDDGEKTLGKEDFPPTPSDHQSILVSFSSRCLSKGTICRQPQIVRIKYYGNSDKPLGRYLRETLFDNIQCRTCEEPAHKHIYCCTHRLGSLTISVRHLDKVHILPGDKEGKIWMWHRCLKCARKDGVPPATSRIVMSDAAWGLSFGKFLELSFSDHAAASRVAACGHLLHRDCLRFYGFGDMIACFRYAPINLHTVRLPPAKLEFNDPNQQDWLRKEASEVAATGELVFAEVLNELRVVGENISNSASWTGKASDARKRIVEFEALLQREKAEFEEALEKAAPTRCEAGQPIADVLELNRLRRELVIRSVQWDKRLHFLSQMVEKANSVGEHAKFSFKYSDAESGFLKPRGGSDITEGLDSPRLGKVGDNDTAMAIAEGGKCDVDMNGFGQSETTEDGAQKLGMDLEDVSSTAAGPVQDSNTEDVSSLGEQACALSLSDPSRNELSEGRGSLLTASSVQRFPELVNVNDIGGGICRTMSDGNYPIVADLSVNPWIEEDHGIDIQITPVEEVIASKQGDANHEASECVVHEVKDSVDTTKSELPSAVDDIPSAICVVDDNAHVSLEKSDNEVEPLLNAPSLAKPTDGSDDLGNWIGAPFSTLYRGYSKGSFGNLPSSPPKSDTRAPVSASPIISRVGQVAIQGGAKVLPPGVDDTVVIVYDDEPTSIIAYAILTHEYQAHVSGVPLDKEKQRDREKERERDQKETANVNGSLVHPLQSPDGTENEASSKEKVLLKENSFIIDNDDPLLSNKGSNVKIDFSDENLEGKIRYSVTAYYAKHFSALRKKCCAGELEFVRSLSRCRKWGAQGGKSNVFFAKTLDDRFIIKQVTRTELHSFLQFAPEYFKYLSESINTGSPTCLAKILGMFQVTVRQSKGGKEVSMDLMVMENLLFGRHLTRVYDLKGSLRSRYNADLTGQNTVLLDQNLLEAMPTAPIFVGNKAKRLLERAVWNDTSFLASVDVMDYSLLVGVDEQRQELVLGIIDFMRQYTWDKHLETWVKQSGILGGPKNAPPTVISPKQYKKRFRKAMTTYFVTVPDQWTPPSIITAPSIGKGLEDASSSNPQDDSSLSLKAQ